MSKGGHTLTGVAVGGFIALGFPHYVLLGVVAACCGTLPDSAEIVTGFGPNGERMSVIPHRTLTHWPVPWILMLIIGLLLPPVSTPLGILPLGHALAGIGAGAIVHLMFDLLSPSGVPLLTPFGPRTSFGPGRSGGHPFLYRTSTHEEWPILWPFVAMVAAEIAAIGMRVVIGGIPSALSLFQFFR